MSENENERERKAKKGNTHTHTSQTHSVASAINHLASRSFSSPYIRRVCSTENADDREIDHFRQFRQEALFLQRASFHPARNMRRIEMDYDRFRGI